MGRFRYVFALLLLGSVVVTAAQEFPLLSLSAKLSAIDTSSVRFSLQNTGPSAVSVLKWWTPLEGLRSDLFDILVGGETSAAVYTGVSRFMGTPEPEDFLELAAGQTTGVVLDLSKVYSWSQKVGRPSSQSVVTVTLKDWAVAHVTRVDAVHKSHNNRSGENFEYSGLEVFCTNGKSECEQGIPMGSLVTRLELFQEQEPEQFFLKDEISASDDSEAAKVGTSAKFIGCTYAQKKALLAGQYQARSFAYYSYFNSILGGRAWNVNQWLTWYGNRWSNSVQHGYARMFHSASDNMYTYDCTDAHNHCRKGIVAYVYPNRFPIVYVCLNGGYYSYKTCERDQYCQGGIMVHEYSHFDVIAKTRDGKGGYGKAAAMELAKKSPSAARATANNWGYYSTANAQWC